MDRPRLRIAQAELWTPQTVPAAKRKQAGALSRVEAGRYVVTRTDPLRWRVDAAKHAVADRLRDVHLHAKAPDGTAVQG